MMSEGLDQVLGEALSGTVGAIDASPMAAAAVKMSPTALDVGRWSQRRGKEFFCGELARAVVGCAEAELRPEESRMENAAVDMWSACFEYDPQLVESCEDSGRLQFMRLLLEQPEYQAVHREVCGDDFASELAATAFFGEWLKLAAKQQEGPEERDADDTEGGSGGEPDLKTVVAAARAATGASEEVGKLRDAQAAMGMGGDGPEGGKMSLTETVELMKRVRNSDQLREIIESAGRYMRAARSFQQSKTDHGYDDLVDTELSGDVGRLVPTELMMLTDPDFEWQALQRIVERQALCRRYEGVEKLGKGPIILTVDTSGSMGGQKVVNAKSIALAVLWVARFQKRECVLVDYSGGAKPLCWWARSDNAGLVEWLENFYSGGTDLDIPVGQLPGEIWPEFIKRFPHAKGKTDLIMITDAICWVPDELAAAFNEWRKLAQVRVQTIVIGGHGKRAESIGGISDEVFFDRDLDVGGDAVESAFSV